MSETTARPRASRVFSEHVLPVVKDWCAGRVKASGKTVDEVFAYSLPQEDEDFIRLIESAAFHEGTNCDAYKMARSLETVLEWPVDAELVVLFHRGWMHVERTLLRQKTIEWVMATGTRFPTDAKEVDFFDPEKQFIRKAKVLTVDRPTASAVVDLFGERRTLLAEDLRA